MSAKYIEGGAANMAQVFSGWDLKLMFQQAQFGNKETAYTLILYLLKNLSPMGEREDLVPMYHSLLRVLVRQKDPLGMRLLADEYIDGRHVERSIHKAVRLLDRAIALGDLWACEKKGLLFFEDRYTPHNYFLALECLEEAFEGYCAYYEENEWEWMDTVFLTDDADIYIETGEFVGEVKEALLGAALSKLSNPACYALGEIYRKGLCGEKDFAKAHRFYYSMLDYRPEEGDYDPYYCLASFWAPLLTLNELKDVSSKEDIRQAIITLEQAPRFFPKRAWLSQKLEDAFREVLQNVTLSQILYDFDYQVEPEPS